MSGAFPTTPAPKSTELKSFISVDETFSESAKRQALITGGHLWKAKAVYPVMERSNFGAVFAFCAKQRNSSFTIKVAPHDEPLGTVTGTVKINGAAVAGAKSFAIDGITGTLLAGDFIQFASHSKMYRVVSDRSGAGTLTITPRLVEAVANDIDINYSGLSFTMILESDPSELKVTRHGFASYVVNMVEYLS